MEQARNLGLALIALGFVELAWVLFCVFGGLVLGLVGFADDEFGPLMWLLSGAYGVLAVANLPIALLHVVAGIRLRQGKGLILAVAALAASLASFLLALYCTPFTLVVVIYGVYVLARSEVRAAIDAA